MEEPSPVGLGRAKRPQDVEILQTSHAPTIEPTTTPNKPHLTPQERVSSLATPTRKSTRPNHPATPENQRKHRAQLATEKKSPPLPRVVVAGAPRGSNPFKRRSYKEDMPSDAMSSTRKPPESRKTPARTSQDTQGSTGKKISVEIEEKTPRDGLKADVFGLGRSRLSGWRFGRRLRTSTDAGSPVARTSGPRGYEAATTELQGEDLQGGDRAHLRSTPPPIRENREHSNEKPSALIGPSTSHTTAQELNPEREVEPFSPAPPIYSEREKPGQTFGYLDQSRPLRAFSGNIAAQRHSENTDPWVRKVTTSKSTVVPNSATIQSGLRGPEHTPEHPTLGTVPRSTPVRSAGTAVKAMAAKFESVSKDSIPPSSPQERASSRADSRPSGMLSPYTTNPSPVKSPSKSPMNQNSAPTGRHVWLSAIRDRRSRVAHEERVKDKNLDGWEEMSPKQAKGNMAHALHDKFMSSGSEAGVGLRTPRGESPKELRTPGDPSSCAGMGEFPPTGELPLQRAPDIEQRVPSERPLANAPHLLHEPQPDQSPAHPHGCRSPCPQPSPHMAASPASTTRRFLLVPSPGHGKQATVKPPTPARGSPVTTIPSTPSPNNNRRGATTPSSRPQPRNLPSPGFTGGRNNTHISPRSPGSADRQVDSGMRLELARVREQLGLAEQACAKWRERAERAEQRVLDLERMVDGFSGVEHVGGSKGGGFARGMGFAGRRGASLGGIGGQ